jgi:hypothetical protein
MEQEISLQGQKYEDNQRQQKNKHINVEQQISYLKKMKSPKLNTSQKYSRLHFARQISTRYQTMDNTRLQLKPTPTYQYSRIKLNALHNNASYKPLKSMALF